MFRLIAIVAALCLAVSIPAVLLRAGASQAPPVPINAADGPWFLFQDTVPELDRDIEIFASPNIHVDGGQVRVVVGIAYQRSGGCKLWHNLVVDTRWKDAVDLGSITVEPTVTWGEVTNRSQLQVRAQ